jgi:hypothetical protein
MNRNNRRKKEKEKSIIKWRKQSKVMAKENGVKWHGGEDVK